MEYLVWAWRVHLGHISIIDVPALIRERVAYIVTTIPKGDSTNEH